MFSVINFSYDLKYSIKLSNYLNLLE